MRKMRFLVLIMLIITSFEGFSQDNTTPENDLAVPHLSVGEDFSLTEYLNIQQLGELYKNLKEGDSLSLIFKADVASVCKKKGCWLKVELEDATEVLVKFKDYAFFVPTEIEDETIWLKGKAYVTELTVEEQRHYAEDAGKPAEEVLAIEEPSRTLSFLADGVKIKGQE